MIRAAILDFGGVLVSDRASIARLAEFDAMLGWEPGTLRLRLYSGEAWEAVSTGRLSIDDYWAIVGAPLAARLPPDFPHFRDNFHGDHLDPAMITLARRLRRRHHIALLSNATAQLADRLAEAPELAGLFDVVLISALEGMRKPEPAIYRRAWQRLGLPPQACVLIDDKERNTAVAEALGMAAITHTEVQTSERALRNLGLTLD